MKKNLRIVSAAAALLAVAPVAATVVPAASTTVSAAQNTTLSLSNNVKFTQGPTRITTKEFSANDLTWNDLAYPATTLPNDVKDKLGIHLPINITATDAAGKSYSFALNPQPSNVTVNGYDLTKNDPNSDQAGAKYGNKLVKSGETYTLSATYDLGAAGETKIKSLVANKTLTIDGKTISFDANSQGKVTVTKTFNIGDVTQTPDSSKPTIDAGEGNDTIFNAEANTSATINAVAAKHVNKTVIPGAINGSVNVSLGGKNYTALLHTQGNNNNVQVVTHNKKTPVTDFTKFTAGHYYAIIRDATVALDNQYANTTQTFTLAKGTFANGKHTEKVAVNASGVADLGTITVPFYAYDATKEQGVHFYEVANGNVVTSGNVTLHAVNGKISVQSLYAAMNAKYGASQFRGGLDNDPDVLKPVNDLRDQLQKQNISVDPNGYFTAPASFSVNMNAKSNLNGAEATLPVAVTVDNATPATTNETTKNVTIMHISTIYDKNGKATHEPALRAYDTYSVVSTPVSLKDEKGKDAGMFYKLAGKDQYIKVGNVDGTKRSLKKSSYVYKSTGKAYMKSKKHHRVLKAGSSVTTYGKSFMIAGHQMYRIGKNQYVKKANF